MPRERICGGVLNIETVIVKNMIHKLILLLFSLVIFSCKQENKLKQNNKSKSQVNKEQLIEYKFDFPDTVFVNEKYKGVIDYKSILDTITTSFDDKKNNRYVLFLLSISKEKPVYDFVYLKEHIKDTFGAFNNRIINITDVEFSEVGEFYIDGIINDLVAIETDIKDEDGLNMIRLIENEQRVTHKVIVIRRPTKVN